MIVLMFKERFAALVLAGVKPHTVRPKRKRPVKVADAHGAGREVQWLEKPAGAEHAAAERGDWWADEPAMGRVVHGLAARVDRLRALGNGQVPAVVRLAWRTLSNL